MFSFSIGRGTRLAAIICTILPGVLPGVCAGQGTAPEAKAEGKISLDLRYRFEYVDEDGFDNTARASLLRSRITMTSPEVSGFSVGLEIDDVSNIGVDDYNSTENGKTDYPTISPIPREPASIRPF